MGWAGHVARVAETKKPLGCHRRSLEDNTGMHRR